MVPRNSTVHWSGAGDRLFWGACRPLTAFNHFSGAVPFWWRNYSRIWLVCPLHGTAYHLKSLMVPGMIFSANNLTGFAVVLVCCLSLPTFSCCTASGSRMLLFSFCMLFFFTMCSRDIKTLANPYRWPATRLRGWTWARRTSVRLVGGCTARSPLHCSDHVSLETPYFFLSLLTFLFFARSGPFSWSNKATTCVWKPLLMYSEILYRRVMP